MSWNKILHALANGVEMKLHMEYHLSDIAIECSKSLARDLEIPEEEIASWAQERKSRAAAHDKDIKSLLDKLYKSGIARDIMKNFILYKNKTNDDVN